MRELRNTVEYALLTCHENIINKNALPPYFWGRKPAPFKGKGDLREYNQAAVIAALEDSNGNISAAARNLGIARNTLYKKMREFNLQPHQPGPS